jgi:hypothetical protein
LAEIIGLQFRYRLLFEPEHEFQTEQGHLICDQWLTASNVTNAQEQYLIKILKNNVDSDWIAQCSNRKLKRHLWPILPKKYVVKFVRGNLGSVYLNERFKIPVLFITRNPYDVIFSQNRVKFPWLYNLEHFKKQKKITELLAENYDFNWLDVEHYSGIEKLALRWCIENKLVFNKESTLPSNFKILKYEDLKSDINIFYGLCKEFDLKPLENIEEIYTTPSSKTHRRSTIRTENKNKETLSLTDIEKIRVVLKRFDVNEYDMPV